MKEKPHRPATKAPVPLTPARKKKFISLLASNGGIVKYASQDLGIGSRTLYMHRKSDRAFGQQWDEAVAEGTMQLVTEAHRRALDGSDALLMFLLKGRQPEIFRERHDFRHSGSIKTGAADFDEAELAAIARTGSAGTTTEEESVPALPDLH